jgi:helix-turn-helix protein
MTIQIGKTYRVADRNEPCFGMVGKAVEDSMNGKEFTAIEFDTPKDYMWGDKDNRWYVYNSKLKAVKSDTLTLGTPTLADDLRLGNQCRKILAHLLRYGEVTNNAAFITYHVSRLSDVIMKLRRAGYDITTEMKKDGVGGQYAKYLLVK